jgi:hypothetical protein
LYNPATIPDAWKEDAEFAKKLQPYVAQEIVGVSPGPAAHLASTLDAAASRDALLKGLNAWRPYSAARALAQDHLDNQTVRDALIGRLRGNFKQAASMAGVATTVLGMSEGFSVLLICSGKPLQNPKVRAALLSPKP